MESIKEIYRIGNGPSSSHTMGPKKAAAQFLKDNSDSAKFKVTLFGSLAATGKGHLTDVALEDVFANQSMEIIWKPKIFLPEHPNGMKFEAFNNEDKLVSDWTVFSSGGGKISDFSAEEELIHVYPHNNMAEILDWMTKNGRSFWEYVEIHEGPDIFDFLLEAWRIMVDSIKRGIENEGVLPGGLNVKRKASSYYVKAKSYSGSLQGKTQIFAYALGVAEENAAGGLMVTSPTCGSCGVLPAVLYRMKTSYDFSKKKIAKAMATAGLIGAIVKQNASISGAEVGCQGEIGTACAMASAAVAQLLGGSPSQIEYAAEMGIEHHLGLTCDPVAGLVQVPCIERNAFAAERALNTATYALLSDGNHLISFDKIVKTMKQTGHDLPSIYKETSEGGMAIFGI